MLAVFLFFFFFFAFFGLAATPTIATDWFGDTYNEPERSKLAF